MPTTMTTAIVSLIVSWGIICAMTTAVDSSGLLHSQNGQQFVHEFSFHHYSPLAHFEFASS
jgi:hypothetical protein